MIMTQAGTVWVFDVQSEGGGCPRPRHLCTDSLTIDSTWFWGQRRRQTLGTMWKNPLCVSVPYKHTYIYIRIYIFIYLTLYLSLPIFLPLWQMLCVVGCMPHADWTPSALLELRATCATHSNSNPHLPAHTHTHTICTWVSGRVCWGRKTHRDLTVLLLGQWPI